jgi:diguanylate cyclase (GGDEF)-like protein/PAS domain S-box-containing protein
MNFWRLVSPDLLTETVVRGDHNHGIPLAGMLLATLAAWVLLPVAHRFNAIRNHTRYLWLAAGSCAMGIGIWAMHFTSMMVYHLPFPIEYDVAVTLWSMLPAMLASAVCIMTYMSARDSWSKLLIAAMCIAVGIGFMHYLGMEAIIVPADMYYVPLYFMLSIGAAAVLALIGLYAKTRLDRNAHVPRFIGNLAGSVILGLAVTSMHFIAMHATYFVAHDHVHAATHTDTQPVALFAGIVVATVLLLGLTLFGTIVDRRLDRMASSLKQSELRFQRLAETTQMAIFTFNASHVTYANPALSSITGYSLDELQNTSLARIFGLEFQDFARSVLDSGAQFGQAYYEQFEIRTKQGGTCWLYFSVTPAEIDKHATCLASACDISEQKRAELSLRRLAFTDQLTQIGNRTMFIDRLGHHLDLLVRRRLPAQSCVLLLDLDNFKAINDTYGHVQGDLLLQEVARRLKPLARHCDTIARLGGDEFIILAEEMSSHHDATTIANRILAELNTPIALNNREIPVHTSIGIVTLDPARYQTPDQVLHDVDIALYRAKAQGRRCWVLYDDEIDARVKRARMLVTELKVAIAAGDLQLYYQPIFSAATQTLRGFEGLARWQRTNGEWVSPDEFIPLAEENGLVGEITLWAIEAATRQIAEWNAQWQESEYYISVNVANDSFTDDRFFKLIADRIAERGIRKGQLKLELTERMLVSDTRQMLERLDSLIALGCELMIDDFGTGYSSLSYLHRLPVKTLKIDRSFVANLEEDLSSRAVINSIIALAKTLKMDVISEGVETPEQSRLLAGMGATQIQGYLYGRPTSAEQAGVILGNAAPLPAPLNRITSS